MFCPRCGIPNSETTKFCRQCGLSLTQVSSYVATGGTGHLKTPSAPPLTDQLAQLTAGYSPRQKMILTILCLVFFPGAVAIITDPLGLDNFFVPLAGVLMCVGIPWAVIHFRNQARWLAQQQWLAQAAMMQPGLNAPPAQAYLQPPQQMPIQAPAAQPIQTPYAPPVNYAPPVAAPQAAGPNTNPLGPARGSVIEDDTRRLPGQ